MAAQARSGVSDAGFARRLREAERRRLSRLLHDEAGPALCSAGLTAELLRGTLAAITPRQEELFAKLAGALESAVESVRLLSQECAPGLASRRGLEDALRLLAKAHRAGIAFASAPRRLPDSKAEALCELVRDALLALEGAPRRITVLPELIRIEAPPQADPAIARALRGAARNAGFRVRWRCPADGIQWEILLEEDG